MKILSELIWKVDFLPFLLLYYCTNGLLPVLQIKPITCGNDEKGNHIGFHLTPFCNLKQYNQVCKFEKEICVTIKVSDSKTMAHIAVE